MHAGHCMLMTTVRIPAIVTNTLRNKAITAYRMSRGESMLFAGKGEYKSAEQESSPPTRVGSMAAALKLRNDFVFSHGIACVAVLPRFAASAVCR